MDGAMVKEGRRPVPFAMTPDAEGIGGEAAAARKFAASLSHLTGGLAIMGTIWRVAGAGWTWRLSIYPACGLNAGIGSNTIWLACVVTRTIEEGRAAKCNT